MTSTSARVHISLHDGTLEIEGSEAFVAEQLQRFEPLIKGALEASSKLLAKKPADTKSPAESKAVGKDSADTDSAAALDGYPNLFAVADGKVQILKDLPGANKSQKTVSAALLLTYANSLMGTDSTTFDAIRDLCTGHACLDGVNFSKTLKSEKELFLIGGTPKKQTAKLSVPGRKKAEELSKKLNGE